MAFPGSSKSSGGQTIAFPDVCKVPAPPAPFAPVPYPNTQYQTNMQQANTVDAKAQAGNKKAQKLQQEAINNLKASMGDEAGTMKGVKSASQATRTGYVLHQGGVGKPTEGKANAMRMTTLTQQGSFSNSPGVSLTPSQTKLMDL